MLFCGYPNAICHFARIIIATEEKSGDGGRNLRFFFNEFYGITGLENKPIP
jgi:hypothetical protein